MKRRRSTRQTADSAPTKTRLEKFLARSTAPPRGPDGEPLVWDGHEWRPQFTDAERAERLAEIDAAFKALEQRYASGELYAPDDTAGGPDDAA